MRFRFADCVLDAERFELTKGGQPVAVQPKVLNLLLCLLRQHERAVTKQELLDAVCSIAHRLASSVARLEEAEAARLVEAVPGHPGRFRFTHGLIAETLYEALGASQRVRLHARAADALEARYRPQALVPTRAPLPIRGVHLAELAHHFSAALPAGDAAKALDYCERAGEHALALLAFEEAGRHFERALRVLDAATPADDERRARLLAARERASAAAVAS